MTILDHRAAFRLGLADVFCKNTGLFVSSDKKSYHR